MSVANFMCRPRTVATHNVSSVLIPPVISFLLSNGPKFIPTPLSVNFYNEISSLRFSFSDFLRRIRISFQFRLSNRPFAPRTFVSARKYNPSNTPPELEAQLFHLQTKFDEWIKIKRHMNNRSNLSKYEMKLLTAFFDDHPNQILRPADKGLGFVLVDNNDYIAECLRQLTDTYTYSEIFFDTEAEQTIFIEQLRKQALNLVNTYNGHNQLPKNIIDFMLESITNASNKFCTIHGLLKIHKAGPLKNRLISSNTKYITESISTVLDHLLEPFGSLSKSNVKNSAEYVARIEGIQLPNNQPITIAMGDIVNLYPSINHQDAMTTIQQYLHKHADALNVKHNTVTAIMELLDFTMSNSFVQFGERTFHQVNGTAMGTPCAVQYAIIYITALEEPWLEKYHNSIILYNRFIDDQSLIFKLTRALFFIPTTRRRVLIALAVLPLLPIILPISAGETARVSNTPISSTVRSIFTSFGFSTRAFTNISRNSLSVIYQFKIIIKYQRYT